MHHALLMLRPIESESALVRELYDALTEPGDIAVAKNTPDALNEPILASIALDILVRYELHQCLSNRKTNRFTHNFNDSSRSTKLESVASTFLKELSNML
jgi:hypothetical protein